MVTIRRATDGDADEVADFAIEGMRVDLYPGLHLARGKVGAVVRHCISSPGEFQLVAHDDTGRLVGAVGAVVSEMLFFERCEAHVVLCRAIAPGVGRRLLSALREWAIKDMRIRRVIWPHEFHSDPRMAKLAARVGFETVSTVCTFNKE